MDIGFYIVSAFVVVLVGISKSGFAGGLGMLSVPLMSLFVPAPMAAGIMLPIICTIDVVNIWRYRQSWIKAYVFLLIPGALVGMLIGMATFRWLNADMIKIGVGLLALVTAIQYFFISSSQAESKGLIREKVDTFLLGSLSGFTSFIALAGGPPIKAFLLRKNLKKTAFVATNSYFFFVINFLKLPAYFFLGQLNAENFQLSLLLLPFVPIGIFLGFYCHNNIDQRRFMQIAHLLLLLAGLKLLWDGAGELSWF